MGEPYRNEFDKSGRSADDGKRAEANFVRIFTKRFGVEPVKTHEHVDKYDHIDFWLRVKGHKSSVDVKSWKQEPDNIWVEFVSYGRLGWLYGKAEYIAFETPDQESFIMVKRESLVSLVKTACVVEFTNNKDESLFRPYVRYKGKDFERFDCVAKLPRKLLNETDHWILK